MKKSSNKIIIYTAVIVTVFTVAVIATQTYKNRIAADQNIKQTEAFANTITTVSDESAALEPDSRAEVTVPILMYHHIRNYQNPKDPIGENLSVSPQNFKEQIDYIKSAGYTTITMSEFAKFPKKKLPEKPIVLTFDDGYSDMFQNAYLPLKENNQIGVFYIISSYIGRNEHLSNEQIALLSSDNMEIGSHTISHPDLTKIPTPKANNEISRSRLELEKIIGKPVISFCYPSGKYSQETVNQLQISNYTNATTTKEGIAKTSDNKFELKRIRVLKTDSVSSLSKKIK